MKVACIIVGILLIAGGIACMVSSGTTITILSIILGITMLCSAASELYKYIKERRFGLENQWSLFGVIFTLILSLAMLFSSKLQSALSVILALAAGLWVVGVGVNQIFTAMKKKSTITLFGHSFGEKTWMVSAAYGGLLVIFGVLCMLSPAFFSQALDVLLGIAIILCGIEAFAVASVM